MLAKHISDLRVDFRIYQSFAQKRTKIAQVVIYFFF